MPRTPTLPPTERAMWRKLLARVHPDAGGDHELFIWARNLHDAVCGGVREDPTPPPEQKAPRSTAKKEGPARVPFDEDAQSFDALTERAVSLADTVDAPYDRLLGLLDDLDEEGEDHPLYAQQFLGATYRTLAATGAYRNPGTGGGRPSTSDRRRQRAWAVPGPSSRWTAELPGAGTAVNNEVELRKEDRQ